MNIMLSIINQGLIFSLVAIAVYITSRMIKKDDLTTEGAFGLGGAVTAILLQHQVSAILVMFLALFAGAGIGLVTAFLYARLKMNHLMAGLVSSTACFSLSLALSSASKSIIRQNTIFNYLNIISEEISENIILIFLVLLILSGILLFLKSEIGLIIRAVGDNEELLINFGKSKNLYQSIGFAIANALTALSGCLFVQWSGFFSITGNIGTLVTGLTSLMIGELFYKKLSVIIIGAAIFYQSIFAASLSLGVEPLWNNLVKALIIIGIVIVTKKVKKDLYA